jgi:hypothetical protein
LSHAQEPVPTALSRVKAGKSALTGLVSVAEIADELTVGGSVVKDNMGFRQGAALFTGAVAAPYADLALSISGHDFDGKSLAVVLPVRAN